MADQQIDTLLRFLGEDAGALAAINAVSASLQAAAAQSQALFAPIIAQAAQAASVVQTLTTATNAETDAATRAGGGERERASSVLALAQAVARLQVAEGNAAGAVQTLKAALSEAEAGTVQYVNAQRQLVTIEAQLANAASKADAEIVKQASTLARLAQVSGDSAKALKIIEDAQARLANPNSLAAARLEIQKTYLNTNYANSPLVGMLQQINAGLGRFSPLLGSSGRLVQTFTGGLAQAAASLGSTKANLDANADSANKFFERLRNANQAVVDFVKDQKGEASATDFFLNLSKQASAAGDRIRSVFANIRQSLENALGPSGGGNGLVTTLGLGNVAPAANQATATLSGLTTAAEGSAEGLGAVGAAGGASALALGAVVGVVLALVAALAILITSLTAGTKLLIDMGEAGVKANADLEHLNLGLASVINGIGEVSRNGIKLTGAEQFQASLALATDQVTKLRQEAAAVGLPVQEVVEGLQTTEGPLTRFGLSLDDARKTTINIALAMNALGIPLREIGQESRAILQGQTDRTARLNQILQITKEELAAAKARNDVQGLLNERLAGFAAGGAAFAQSFDGAVARAQSRLTDLERTVTGGLFEALKTKLNDVLDSVAKAGGLQNLFGGIADTLTRIFDTAGGTIGKVIDFIFSSLQAVDRFLAQNRETVGEIIEEVNQIITLIGSTVAGVLRITLGAQDAGKEANVLAGILRAVVVIVGLVGDGIKIWISSFLTVGNALKLAVIAPLEVTVKLFAALVSGIPFIGAAADRAANALESSRKSAVAGVTESAKNFASSIANIGQASKRASEAIDEARKKAAAGQRVTAQAGAPSTAGLAFQARPGTPDDKNKGGKGALDAARASAEALLRITQLAEKEAALANQRITNALRQSLTDRLISIETFTELSIQAERDLLDAKRAAFDAEEKVINDGAASEESAAIKSSKTREAAANKITAIDAKRNEKLAELNLKRQAAEQEADIKTEGLRDDLRRAQEKNEEDHQNRLIAILEVGRRAREASIRTSASVGLVSFEEAEKRLVEIERERFAEREGALNADLERAREDVAKRAEILDELARLAAERAAFEEDASKRIIDAQKKEAEGFTDLITKRVRALSDLRRAQIDAQAAETVLALQRGTITRQQADVAGFQQRREQLRIESEERKAAIQREALDLIEQAKNRAGAAAAIVDIERVKNERLKAEKERAAAEDAALENQQNAVRLTPIFGEDAAQRIAAFEQTTGAAATTLEKLQLAAQATADSLSESLPTIGELFDQSALAVANASATMLSSFLSGKEPIRKAAAALFAAALQPLKDYLNKRARAEFAIAAAEFAAGNYVGGAKHTLAGIALIGAAALIDVGAGLIGGGGSAGGAIAGGGVSSSGGTQDTGPRVISQDTPRPQLVPVVIRPELNFRADLTGGILSIVHDDITNNGRTRALIQETNPV